MHSSAFLKKMYDAYYAPLDHYHVELMDVAFFRCFSRIELVWTIFSL